MGRVSGHCEALAEQWGEFVVSRQARADTLVFPKEKEFMNHYYGLGIVVITVILVDPPKELEFPSI